MGAIVAIEVAIYRMGNRPDTKSPGEIINLQNGKENGKSFQARNVRKMAAEMEKWTPKWDFGPFFHFGGFKRSKVKN